MFKSPLWFTNDELQTTVDLKGRESKGLAFINRYLYSKLLPGEWILWKVVDEYISESWKVVRGIPGFPVDIFFFLFSRQVMPDSFWNPTEVARQAPLSMVFSRQEY